MIFRKNVRYLSDSEMQQFVAAVIALKDELGADNVSTYDRYVRWHMEAMARPTSAGNPWWVQNQAHRGPAFAPWHRKFIRLFEQDLQRVAQDPTLALPYWDWTQDSHDPANAPIWFLEFLGGNGNPNNNNQITDGPFSVPSWLTVEAVFDVNNNLQGFQTGGGLQRSFSTQLGLPTQSDVDMLMNLDTFDESPWDASVSSTFRNILEGWEGPGIHNLVHRWVGGSMTAGTSPNDPVFFLHHCNVDRLWHLWQEKYPNAPFMPETGASTGHNLHDPMFPWDGQTTPVLTTAALMLHVDEVVYV